MNKALTKTDFHFEGQTSVYHGKVRDVYSVKDDLLVMVATDRISAFDVVLPKGIPYKGQMLNQIAAKFLDATADIVPNWKLATPDPMVTVGLRCQGFPVEMIVRAYLCGSAWRAYKAGAREICGVPLPDGMRENQAFPAPIITPTTKAELGLHDEDISKQEILDRGLVSPGRLRPARTVHPRPLPPGHGGGRTPRADTRRHEIRVRQARRQGVPHRRNPHPPTLRATSTPTATANASNAARPSASCPRSSCANGSWTTASKASPASRCPK